MTPQRLAQPETELADLESATVDVFPYTGGRSGTDLRTASTAPATCPDCGASTVSVQGLADCSDCEWAGR